MGTNAGTAHLDMEVDTPIGTCYDNEQGRTNIQSIGETVLECYRKNDGSHVKFDSRVANIFYHVRGDGSAVEYPYSNRGIYEATIPESIVRDIEQYKQQHPQNVQTFAWKH